MRTLALCILCFLTLSATAQTQGDSVLTTAKSDSTTAVKPRKLSLIRRVVRGFDRLDERYIEPQHYVFSAMIQATGNYDIYRLRSKGDRSQSVTFAPDEELRIGPYAGWKWVFLGYTFSLNNLDVGSGKHEFDLSIYSSQIGVDLFYRRTGNDYKVRNADLGDEVDASPLENLSFGGLRSGVTGFNVYYIFNHGRFSYPAAFSQSTIQKISCGSWLAGFGYMRNSIELDHNSLQTLIDQHLGQQSVPLDSGLMFERVKYIDFSLSAGYAYNWVFAKNWLFNASIQAAIAHKRSIGQVAGPFYRNFSFDNLNIDGIGRFALVYNNMRWYVGSSLILHTYNYHRSRLSSNNTFGTLNVYVGCNFGLKRKYRQ